MQVITELAVVNSHPQHAAAAMDVFVWKEGEEPIMHKVEWAAVEGRRLRNLLPKANTFYFNVLAPELLRRQSGAAMG